MLPLLLLASVSSTAYARAHVLYSPSGRYAFPVAADVADMAWTHYHWNGGNAVDILPAPNLRPGTAAFDAFEHAPIVAVVAGTVKPATNELGGTALLLFGNDGREYYYAHLSSTPITRPTRVTVGERIGTIGNTGRWARYIEIHLHLAITSQWHHGLQWPNNINVAEWIEQTFGLPWIDQNARPYPASRPHGSPLAEPYRISATFAAMRAKNPDTASIRMTPSFEQAPSVPVYSTLWGEVRVMRATVFGLRVQITNRHSGQTVVYSGLSRAVCRTGEVVNAGRIVGWTKAPIDYMYFDKGVLANPTPMLAAGIDRPGSAAPIGEPGTGARGDAAALPETGGTPGPTTSPAVPAAPNPSGSPRRGAADAALLN